MSRSNLLGTLIFFGFIVLSNAVFVISETERGVLFKFGEVVDSDLEPGFILKCRLSIRYGSSMVVY